MVTRPSDFWSPRLATLCLAALAGATYAAVLPPSAIGWAGWCVLVPVGWLTRRSSNPRDTALWGATFGFASVAAPLAWVGGALVASNRVSLGFAAAATLFTYGFAAVTFAVFALLTLALRRRMPLVLALPVAWVTLEVVRVDVLLGVPWLLLGHSQSDVAATRASAAFLGVPGLSFAMVFVNAALAEALSRGETRRRRAHAALAVTGLFAVCALALVRGHGYAPAGDGDSPLRFGLLQAAVPQEERWVPALANRNLQRQLRLSRRAALAGADLVVWSETALDFLPDRAPALAGLLSEAMLHRPDMRLLMGAPRRETEGGALFNGAVLFDGEGNELAAYNKIHLLPLQEYTPSWVDEVPGARRALGPMLSPHPYESGARPSLIPTPAGPAGVLICYEGMFATLAQQLREQGAAFLVNLSNDAVFASARASAELFAATRFVPIESGLPLVRVSNRGTTGIVDPLGGLSESPAPDQPGFVIATLPAPLPAPLVARVGRFFGAGVALVALAVVALRRPRQE